MTCLRGPSQPGFDKAPQLLSARRPGPAPPVKSVCLRFKVLPHLWVKLGRRNRFFPLRLTTCGPLGMKSLPRESRWSWDPEGGPASPLVPQ